MNNRKEIIIGFIVGIIANTFGTLLYILLFSRIGLCIGAGNCLFIVRLQSSGR